MVPHWVDKAWREGLQLREACSDAEGENLLVLFGGPFCKYYCKTGTY
jgi:hypothetical protein